MATFGIDPVTQLAFSISENRGVFAVLMGSGLSRAAGIPTGWEITLDLIRRLAAAQGVTKEADWEEWYFKRTGEAPNYSSILKELASTPAERRAILHSYIEPTPEDRAAGRKVPTIAHYAIADMVVAGLIRVIITTNFDRLTETALRERGIEPTVVSSVDALRGAEPIAHSKCYLLKLHGDYKDARIRNTDSELAGYPSKFDSLLDRIFDEYGLIVCGWSGEWDEALRTAILRTPNRRYPIYWAARDNLSERATDLATHRGAKIIRIAEADAFFRDIRDRVETLEQARRIDPRSIELTIANAKRFLARTEHRIELDDLMTREADHLASLTDNDKFPCQIEWSDQEFIQRIGRYEAAAETLARIAGVLGRWGDGSELAPMCDLVGSLQTQASASAGGIVALLNIRSYPALLVAVAYGLGLVRAQRWHDLHKFFRSRMTREERTPMPIVETLTPWPWNGNDNRLWQRIQGLERHHTALSDHLVEVFREWGKSFIGLTSDFVLLFERYEMLASMAHFEQYDLLSLQKARAEKPREPFAYAPSGRFSWDTSNHIALVEQLQSEAVKPKLLDAGFAKGSPDLMALFFEALKFGSERMRWY